MACKGARPESKAIPVLRAAQIFRFRVIKLKNSEWRRFYMSDRLDVVF